MKAKAASGTVVKNAGSHKVQKPESGSARNSTSTRESDDQQGSHGGSQNSRPQKQNLSRVKGQGNMSPAVPSVKVSLPSPTSAASIGDGKRTQRKRRRRAKKRSYEDGLQQTIADKQAVVDQNEKSPILQADKEQNKIKDALDSEVHNSVAPSEGAPQVRQEGMRGNLQPAIIDRGNNFRQPSPAGQTVKLGSADSLAFLMGLGLSAEAASNTLNTVLSAASDGRTPPGSISVLQVRRPSFAAHEAPSSKFNRSALKECVGADGGSVPLPGGTQYQSAGPWPGVCQMPRAAQLPRR